jgi:hypothetical protein
MEVSGKLHVQAALILRLRALGSHFIGGHRVTCGLEKFSVLCRELNPDPLDTQLTARRYTNSAISVLSNQRKTQNFTFPENITLISSLCPSSQHIKTFAQI